MLKIGDFSKLSRISIRMLRHYDEIGLLVPENIDPFSGYRYYDESQLLLAERIHGLKNMGFGLSVIGEILSKYENTEEMEQFLILKLKELQDEQEKLEQRIALLDNTIRWLRKDGNIMNYNVTLKTLPERYVASVRQAIPSYDKEGILWQMLYGETAHLNMQEGKPANAMTIYHDGEYKEWDIDAEIQTTVAGTYNDTEHVKFKTVPEVTFASAVFQGGYEKIQSVNQAVAQWIKDNGYELSGLSFNIYHIGPGNSSNPEEFITEVCYPVSKKK
jgi:DNA-binding transcriptional MerR regulator